MLSPSGVMTSNPVPMVGFEYTRTLLFSAKFLTTWKSFRDLKSSYSVPKKRENKPKQANTLIPRKVITNQGRGQKEGKKRAKRGQKEGKKRAKRKKKKEPESFCSRSLSICQRRI